MIDDMDFDGKVVLICVDLNVFVDVGQVIDVMCIEKIVLIIWDIQEKGGIFVLLVYFDRLKGKCVDSMSLKVVIFVLEVVLGQLVKFVEEVIGGLVKCVVVDLVKGDVLFLENICFYFGEEENDLIFVVLLVVFGQVYVNDVFLVVYCVYVLIEGIVWLLFVVVGWLMEVELKVLDVVFGVLQCLVVVVVGGVKVLIKLDLLGNLIIKVDYLVIGGGMVNIFFVVQGIEVGKLLVECDMVDIVCEILVKVQDSGCMIYLFVDIVVVCEFKVNVENQILFVDVCFVDVMIFDVGFEIVVRIVEVFDSVCMLIWNGLLGVFEIVFFDVVINVIV